MPAPQPKTLRQGREEYFQKNGFSEAGYSDKWVPLKAGPFTFFLPNTRARVRAVRRHDLHHVLTGYPATWTGEAEIAAWELASGCGNFYAAWVLNIAAGALGLFLDPGAVFRAFRKGRKEKNLYTREWDDAWLDQSVDHWRKLLQISDLENSLEEKPVQKFSILSEAQQRERFSKSLLGHWISASGTFSIMMHTEWEFRTDHTGTLTHFSAMRGTEKEDFEWKQTGDCQFTYKDADDTEWTLVRYGFKKVETDGGEVLTVVEIEEDGALTHYFLGESPICFLGD